jgi:membrane protease YdiL (CAAX protease family)
VAGGIGILAFARAFLGHLPREFLESAKGFSPPWYTRILYGGITEEILVRWGLMSFLVWCCFRLTQKSDTGIRSSNYVIAIVLSALIFGAAHLPVASLLSPVLTFQLIIYIILGNAIFGIIAGFLYWRRGLECAILAHVLAHITMLAGEALA